MKNFIWPVHLLLCMLFLTVANAAPIPASLYGHWLKTDGSNRFVIGLYPNAACYENQTWRIRSAKELQGRWQIQLEQGGKTARVTLQAKDSNTLLLGEGSQQVLRKTNTFNSSYRPAQPAFSSQLFTAGSAQLRGIVQWNGKRRKDEFYIQLYYYDMYTGRTEYLFADPDSLGRYSIHIPLRMPVICHLSVGPNPPAASFLVQPGDTLLLAFNATISTDDTNQDDKRLLQRVCLMGAEAAFNNQYQHYTRQVTRWSFKMPGEAYNNRTGGLQNLQFDRCSTLYDKILKDIDSTYPAYAAEQRFIDFIKAETRYNCVKEMIELTDSSYLQKTYDKYLSQETPLSFIHDSYCRLAGTFAYRMLTCRFNNYYTYPVNYEKLAERLQKDYRSSFPANYPNQFNDLNRDWDNITAREDTLLIQKNFKGNLEEYLTFRLLLKKLIMEVQKESIDSLAYPFYERTIPNASFRFALNLQQLQSDAANTGYMPAPSLFRTTLFKQYSQLAGMPYERVININTANEEAYGKVNLELTLNTQVIRPLDREDQWQKLLQANRGKTVVVWTFSTSFYRDMAAHALYEMKKLQENYRGKNVVFLKFIENHKRSDRVKQLIQYLDLFNAQGQLNNVFYIDGLMSVRTMGREDINNCCAIYDTSGLVHHPLYHSLPIDQRNRSTFTLANELDSILTGKGRYYEKRGDYYLLASERPMNMSDYTKDKTWRLFDSCSHFYIYGTLIPDKPSLKDSVFHLISLKNDFTWMESNLVFHRLPQAKKFDGSYDARDYSKENIRSNTPHTYRYEPRKRILQLFDDNKKLFRTYSVVFLSYDCLVLKLMP